VSYTNNRRNGFTYDAAGNLTNDLGQTFTYDATGQQASASYSGYTLQQKYDGDRLRVKKVENSTATYYLRSTVLGGQIVAEISASGAMTRGFVYLGGQLLAVQQNSQVSWVHQDPVAKSKRVTNGSGTVISTVELDPWGGDTNRSSNEALQPRRFTTYDRDGNASDEAMHRRYNRWHMRFDQPDPYGGSYDMTNPQSLNRYSYVLNDPVNFVDPSGLQTCGVEFSYSECGGGGGFWGGSRGFGGHVGAYNREYGGLSPRVAEGMAAHNERLQNTLDALAADRALQQALTSNDLEDWERLLELLERNDTLVITTSQPNPLALVLLAAGGNGAESTPAVAGPLIRILVGIAARLMARRAVASAVTVVFGHGARHLAGTGLSQSTVEVAIRTQLQNALANASASGPFWGRVVVQGVTIEYRAYTLANGTINVGTYYPIP
jgi:RHS repeat-associated protein